MMNNNRFLKAKVLIIQLLRSSNRLKTQARNSNKIMRMVIIMKMIMM